MNGINKTNSIHLVTLVMFALLFSQTQAQTEKKPIEVIVEAVREDEFVDRIETLGTLRADESVHLTSSVSEIITAIKFDDGQRVTAGEVLVEMTSSEEHALLEEAQFTLDEAQRQLERVDSLVKQGVASQALLDERKRDFKTAKARLMAVHSRLQDRLVVAPFSGVLGLRNISVGALVKPGDLITTLNNDERMKLDFTVSAIHLSDLKPGLLIVAKTHAFGDRQFNGIVSSVDNQIDPVTHSISVRAILPNEDGLLRHGLLLNVELYKNQRQSKVISEAALMPEARSNFVLVTAIKEGRVFVEKRKVQIGTRRTGEVEILDGLNFGEQVVTHGNFKVQHNQSIFIKAIDTGEEKLADLLNSLPTPSVTFSTATDDASGVR